MRKRDSLNQKYEFVVYIIEIVKIVKNQPIFNGFEQPLFAILKKLF